MTLIKKQADEAQKAQARADYIAAIAREEREWKAEHQKEADEYAKKHNLVTVQDHINHIKNRWSAHSSKPGREKPEPETQKKKCLNCGSTELVRQYDETKTTKLNIVWTDEYRCLTCKERFVL